MAQLYAACRQGGPLVIQNVQTSAGVQQQLDPLFRMQEVMFRDGVNNDVDFTGDWTPEPDEFLVIRGHPEARVLLDAVRQNAIALPVLNAANFEHEGIKALFTAVGPQNQQQILIQGFSPQQALSRKFALMFNGAVFQQIIEPGFSLENSLVAIIDQAGDIRFKSFHLLRRIFDLGQYFRQATDVELHAFCNHASLNVADPNAFVLGADEGIRKSVHALTRANVLGNHPVANIQVQAASIGFPVSVNAGRIDVPLDRKGTKELFSFLLDKVYLGPMRQQLFITNSNRLL